MVHTLYSRSRGSRFLHCDANVLPAGRLAVLALAGFVFLIPIFSLYQLGLYQGVIQPFLGGYIGIMGAIITAVLLPVLTWCFISGLLKFNIIDFVFFAFMVIFTAVSVYSMGDIHVGENAISKAVAIPLIVSFFCVFRMINLESRGAAFVVLTSLIITGVIIYFLQLGVYNQIDQGSIYVSESNESLANYQFFAMIYLFCFIIMAPKLKSRIFRILLYLVSFYILYINGARSEFAVAIIVAGLVELWIAQTRLLIFLVGGLVVFFIVSNLNFLLSSDFEQGRVSALLIDGSGDASFVDRRYTIKNALKTINESPLFGKFGDHEIGFYAHNVLSVWADFGIFGFALFNFGLLLTLRVALKSFFAPVYSAQATSTAIFALTGTALFLLAKAYVHPYFGVMMAVGAQYVQITRRSHFLDSKQALAT